MSESRRSSCGSARVLNRVNSRVRLRSIGEGQKDVLDIFMPSLARSRCSLAREGRFSSLDVRIGSSPSSGFLKLHPGENFSGG
jgi:hypothetical protein